MGREPGSWWCRSLALVAWLLSLGLYWVGYVGSWGFGIAAMAYWSIAALPIAWLTVRWLRRLGAPWKPWERTWILVPWLTLLIVQVPLWLAPDDPVWDGHEWLWAYLDRACMFFPPAVVVWALQRILLTRSVTSGSYKTV
jgi:hypothetical protein